MFSSGSSQADQPVAAFESTVEPNDPRLTAQIEKFLMTR